MTAEAASHAVGYVSPSQFNREFKRLFGLAPAAEKKRMREFHNPARICEPGLRLIPLNRAN